MSKQKLELTWVGKNKEEIVQIEKVYQYLKEFSEL